MLGGSFLSVFFSFLACRFFFCWFCFFRLRWRLLDRSGGGLNVVWYCSERDGFPRVSYDRTAR